MKGFSKYLLAGFLTMGLFACSESNEVPDNGSQDVADAVYMQFKLELPSVGSRSQTDPNDPDTPSNADPDFEVGKDEENTVSSAYIVLAKEDNSTIIAYQELTDMGTAMNSGNTKIYTVEFKSDDLAVTNGGETLNVYAFCNPTTSLTSIITSKGTFADALETLAADEATIWTNNKFLMTNADNKSQITVPADANWKPYYVKTNPFDLGVISVERAAARFDYKAKYKNNTYTILNDKTNNGAASLQVQLTDVALVNMSKSFYYLRRVSNNGLNTNTTIGGLETNTNYVVDTDAAKKNGYTSENWTDKASNFFYNSDDAKGPSAWEWTSLNDITEEDKWIGADGNDGYKIWRYAIENTIPDPISNQKHGITTGVVFRGKLVGDKVTSADKNPIYVYQNVLYGTAAELKAAAENGANPSLTVAYEKAMASATEGQTMDNIDNVGQYNFIRYKANTAGDYEMYYYYWNRHNDNLDPAIMGPMEFAVVRNNVYKLAVESISNYGHPEKPGDDPDPENPDDPDEEVNIYFKVSVKVLPWVVRVNNIEF